MPLHVTMNVPADRESIRAALTGLVHENVVAMSRNGHPPLYQSGVKFRREEPRREHWQSSEELIRAGEGDCEDLVGYRVAELILEGVAAVPEVLELAEGKFHAVVGLPNGEMEDPSLVILQEEAMRKKPTFTLRRVGDHVLGAIEIPLPGGECAQVSELGFDAWGALKKVLSIASNPAVAAMVPPQVAVALQVASKIADMSVPGLRRLLQDKRTTDAQRKLAEKVLEAKEEATPPEVGFSIFDLSPAVQLAKIVKRVATPKKPVRRAPVYAPPAAPPSPAVRPVESPGYPSPPPGYPSPPGYPPPGYPPPGYPPPGYPPVYPTEPAGYPVLPSGWYGDPGGVYVQQAQPLSMDEAAAIALWGSGSFAEGSFPGYQATPAPGGPYETEPYGYEYE